jgi:predicted  nucleic acid-binding Zn-ribbon protein
MAKKQLSTPEKLRALYDLQNIDSKIDRLQVLKGELPLEVEDLEDEIVASNNRIEKVTTDVDELKNDLTGFDVSIKNSNALIERYEKQLENVKNNREFDALTKEVGMQKLEIQLSEKKLRIATEKLEVKSGFAEEMSSKLGTLTDMLESKKAELSEITQETEIEEDKLQKKSERAMKKVDDYFLTAYKRIRSNYKNGLAVVSVDRDACGGCHISIPPQLQIDIENEFKIIPCENCGRIFVPNYEERKKAEKEEAAEA